MLKDIKKIYYVTDIDNYFSNDDRTSMNKRWCLFKIFNFEEINFKKNSIKFETLFFSENLEDVVHHNPDIGKREKEKLSIAFGYKSLKDREYFIKIFKNEDLKIILLLIFFPTS